MLRTYKMNNNIIISTVALLASLYAIYSTRRNVKKQLRLSKLEEIIEILTFMEGYYKSLFWLFHETKDILESNEQGKGIAEKMNYNNEARNEFLEIVTKEMVIDKTTRLTTLSNAYLPNTNNLKLKVNTLATIYYNMYRFICKGDLSEREELSIIPKPPQMERFIQKVEGLVIKEMNLGYKTVTKKDHREYFLKHFKNDIESK